VNYFDDDKAYLTQSGQLYNEATAMALGKTIAFGLRSAREIEDPPPSHRVWMVEPEMAYATIERREARGRRVARFHCGPRA